MIPVTFQEANQVFHAPTDLEQVRPIHAFHGAVRGGSLDGVAMVVTAWLPTPEELAALNAGAPVFLGFVGGLPPHVAGTSFESVTQTA